MTISRPTNISSCRSSRITRKPAVVIDPNETWGQFFKSMLAFDEPKTVPKDSLPEDYDPAKKRFNSLKTLVNWRGQNYIEEFKGEERVEGAEPDVERNVENVSQREGTQKDIEVVKLNTERDEDEFHDTV